MCRSFPPFGGRQETMGGQVAGHHEFLELIPTATVPGAQAGTAAPSHRTGGTSDIPGPKVSCGITPTEARVSTAGAQGWGWCTRPIPSTRGEGRTRQSPKHMCPETRSTATVLWSVKKSRTGPRVARHRSNSTCRPGTADGARAGHLCPQLGWGWGRRCAWTCASPDLRT